MRNAELHAIFVVEMEWFLSDCNESSICFNKRHRLVFQPQIMVEGSRWMRLRAVKCWFYADLAFQTCADLTLIIPVFQGGRYEVTYIYFKKLDYVCMCMHVGTHMLL